ncbi:4Fe-4S dicluster domain-containing protein [Salmonella enterica]
MNRFIIADPAKCIGCRTCEVACVVSHEENQDCSIVTPSRFTARIRVVKTGAFSTAVTCHHCEDAPCARACPMGAIVRNDIGVIVEQSRCIGCKSCMIACPFGAMQVTLIGERAQALKCDLCHHRKSGPACIEACPTSALSCLDPVHLREERLHNLPFC